MDNWSILCDMRDMELTKAQYERIVDLFPKQRGNVRVSNLDALNAILYVAEHGCKWRGLPKHFGPWHTIYTRMKRWNESGVLTRIFVAMQSRQLMKISLEAVSLDSTIVKVHPDGTGALKKTAGRALENHEVAGPPKFIWLPQILERH